MWGFSLVAALLLFLAVWTVIPPPTAPLLLVAVGAPELGSWLALLSLVIAARAVRRARRSGSARLALLLACSTAALAAAPLLRFPFAASRLDTAMKAGLGSEYLSSVDEAARQRFRQHPLDVTELFTGLRSETPWIARSVRYAVNDGVPLSLDIYRPRTPGPHPAIVEIYGGGWQRGMPADNSAFDSYFAAHGFVVFAIDYRHAPRWRWPAQLTDVRAALDWIGRHGIEYDADPGRLAMFGRSSGSQLAMVAAYDSSAPPIRAVVSYYGPVDLAEGYRHPPRPDPLDVRRLLETFLGGTPDDAPDRYRTASPITYVDRILPPTLMIYAARDHVVEPVFGRVLHSRLLATGTTAVYFEIPWAEHGFDAVNGGPSAQLALYYTERFLAWAVEPAIAR